MVAVTLFVVMFVVTTSHPTTTPSTVSTKKLMKRCARKCNLCKAYCVQDFCMPTESHDQAWQWECIVDCVAQQAICFNTCMRELKTQTRCVQKKSQWGIGEGDTASVLFMPAM